MKINYLWDVPSPHFTARAARLVAQGWQLSGITAYQTGSPFSVSFSVPSSIIGWWGGRADHVSGNDYAKGSGHDIISGVPWFNTGAFANAAPYTFGNENPELLVGPGLFDIDTSLIKTFRLKESSSFEIRGEFFNLFNHANFVNPDATLGSPTFGQIHGAQDGRIIQVGAKITF